VRRYLLDTTPLTAYVFGRPGALSVIDPWLDQHEAATSIVVYGEVVEYLMGRPGFSDRHAQLQELLRGITPFFVTYPIMDRYAEIRRQLRPSYGPGLMGDIDTLIAATALEHNLTVVTTDGDFRRVPVSPSSCSIGKASDLGPDAMCLPGWRR